MNVNVPPPLPPAGPVQAVPPVQAPPTHCLQCGSPDFSSITNLPVCEPCRLALVRRPFPFWVKASAAGILVLLVFSLAQARARWSQAVVLKQAEKLAHQGRWNDAFARFEPFKEQAMSTSDVSFSLEYAEAAANSGHLRDAAVILKALVGHQASTSQIARAHELERTLISHMPPESLPSNARVPSAPARVSPTRPSSSGLPAFSTENNAPAPASPTSGLNDIRPDQFPPRSR